MHLPPHPLDEATTAYTTGLSWQEAMAALQAESELADALSAAIGAHEAVFWECAPTGRSHAETPFHFVVVDSPQVARLTPDEDTFRHLLRAPASCFPNLSGDAMLVVPRAHVPSGAAHIASWCRTAPRDEQRAFWAVVGQAMEAWWDRTEAPVWLSTSGLGVSWLHVRLDRAPKYYTHAPFRQRP